MALSLKRRLLTGGAWVVAGKVVTAGSVLILTKILTQLLDKEAYGGYELAYKIVTGTVLVAQLGLHQTAVRLVAESMGRDDPARARAAIGRVYGLVAISAAVVAGAMLLGGVDLLAGGALPGAAPFLAVWIVVSAFQIVNSEIFRGFQDLGKATLFGGAISGVVLIGLLAVLLAVRGTTRLHEIFLLTLISIGLSLAVSTYLVLRRLRRMPAGGQAPTGEVLGISVPIWISLVTTFLLMQSDLLLVNAFAGESARGDYAAASRLVGVVSTSLGLVNLLVPPFIADLWVRGETAKLERILRNAATVAGVPAFVLLGAFLLFGGPMLALFTTDAFRSGAGVLAILALGRLVNVVTGSCGLLLLMTGHQRVQMAITVATALLTVGAAAIAGRTHGAVGVAWCYTAGSILHNLWLLAVARTRTGMWTHVGLPRADELRALFRR